MIALQTREEQEAAFAEWNRDRGKTYLTTEEVIARLRAMKK